MSKYVSVEEIKKYFHEDEWETPDEKWWPEREIAALIDELAKQITTTSDINEQAIKWIQILKERLYGGYSEDEQ